MPVTKAPKSPEVSYRNQLLQLVNLLKQAIASQVEPVLRQFEPEYVNDAYAITLEQVFERLRDAYSSVDQQAKAVASGFTGAVNTANKQRFYAAMENAVGVDLRQVLQNENLTDILIATTRENVALIRSIPDEYLKKVETIVFTGTTQGRSAVSMLKQIQKLGKVTESRARLIARDQTSKLNSALNQQRQQNLGIEEYIWRTSGDERVRSSHAAKNGKRFRWDDPPEDTGHPGQDIQCRCVAQPVIKI